MHAKSDISVISSARAANDPSRRPSQLKLKMTDNQKIPWKRLYVEAAAIVASILLAFSIDAWWGERVDHSRSVAQLKTVEAEFGEVELQLQRYEARLLGLRQAVSDLLPHIGPDSQLQSMDSLNTLIDLSFRASKMVLPTGSLQALLASGELSAVSGVELKALLAAWPAQVSRLHNQSGLLEENREEIIRYLHDKIPTLAIAYKTNQMTHYPKPSFVGEPENIQRDMKVEGLFGNRGMMIEDTLDIVSELKIQVADSVNLIAAELHY